MGKGGGGGGQPTQTTSTSNTSNIPEYAQPYVETMLGATQKQLFNMDDSGNITGFQPYKAYGGTYDAQGNQTSYDPSKAVAGFSPAQQQAQAGIMGLQTPAQYGQAMGLTGQAALGSGALAGQQYALGQTATPENFQQQVGGYMNPYIQQSLAPQLQLANQQYGMAGQQMAGQATGAGAFGGSRNALQQGLNQQNQMLAQNQLISQGYNTAFNAAQNQYNQQGQFQLNANQAALGALGQQGAMGAQLAGLGGQQLQAQQGILNAQNQVGIAQQAQQQQVINQAMQDYANAQQYPLMELGTMSNMLRGLPMQASTTNQYVAAPNQVTQGIGLAGAGASILNATKKAGGVIKEKKMAGGGIASYYEGDVVDSTENNLYEMPIDDLQKELKSPSQKIRQMAQRIMAERQMAGVQKAGGGIIAFDEGTKGNSVGDDAAAAAQQSKDASDLKYGWENTKAATRDILTLPGRGIAGAFETGVTRPLRAMGVDVPYLPSSFYGGDASSLTPHMDALTRQRAAGVAPNAVSQGAAQNSDAYRSVPADGAAPVDNTAPAAAPPARLGINNVPPSGPAGGTQSGRGITNPNGLLPTSGIKGGNAPFGIQAPADADANKSMQDMIAEKEAYMGPNLGVQKERANLMAEKANAADEARRTTALRMAEFFGAWGSTPGNTIVAGLNALKNKVPDFIADMKDASKIRRQIDKDIAELDKVERLEKSGNWEEAAKRRAELGKNALTKYGYDLKAAVDIYQANTQRDVGMAKVGGDKEFLRWQKTEALRANIDKAADQIRTKNKELYDTANMPLPADASDQMKQIKSNAQSRVDALERDIKERRDRTFNTKYNPESDDAVKDATDVVDFSKLPSAKK